MGVAHNCEIMVGAKVWKGEIACPPYSLMADMEMREGNKLIHNHRRKRHGRGNPSISKFEILAETAAWRNNWKVAGSTEDGSTSDKCMIGSDGSGVIVSVRGQNISVRGANTATKINGAITEDSATGQKKFMDRQWAAIIGFCGVETRKQVQTFGSKSKRLKMQRRCAPLWSPKSRNNMLTLTDSPAGCGLATM